MTLLGLLSLVVSIASALLTFTVWVTGLLNKRPRLSAHLVAIPMIENLGELNAPTTFLGAKVELAVVNLSEVPNVLLGVKVTARSKEGGWTGAAKPGVHAERITGFNGFPVNLPPRRLCRVWAWVWIEAPAGSDARGLFAKALAEPQTLCIEMKARRGGRFTSTVASSA